ncbi:16S rRNA methyltransferase [Ventosimonas gracilis]|uniref:Ribosomal RNA small subunit methyltransferase E n=1 Tax=Ventosimonas gracilis TaxID=1680762 RepID=A0A139SNX3_9GAMM|nr:16S rRNA (uracil(1498)-N(3))-methyltransferase [Ventosimonas gracilis]KXU36141.1 16S rRNA methyltransferase [Ventosimonas gracilis]
MRLPRLFIDKPLSLGVHTLPADRAHYLSRVLRRRAFDAVQLFDGSGFEYLGELTPSSKSLQVALKQCLPGLAREKLAIHLGQGLSRGERMDWVIQKATELGASSITPIISERCEVQLKGERSEKRLGHWRQIAISACEQCGRSYLPQINPPQPLKSWLAETGADLKLVLSPQSSSALPCTQPASLALLIGAEGGLTEDEVKKAQLAGFLALRLGPRILRTETAAIAALAVAQQCFGDF